MCKMILLNSFCISISLACICFDSKKSYLHHQNIKLIHMKSKTAISIGNNMCGVRFDVNKLE